MPTSVACQKTLTEIRRLVSRADNQPTTTGIPGLWMIKGNVPTQQLAALYMPMIGLVIQGTKILSVGDRVTKLVGPSYFVLPVHVPATARVHPDRDGNFYMSLGLEINQDLLQAVLKDLPEELLPDGPRAFAACNIGCELLDAWWRLLRLIETPQDIPGLALPYQREILYRVLMGPQGWYLRKLALRESSFARISQAVRWIRDNYARSIDVGKVAAKHGMAVNTFHRKFKQSTGLSPIQFQKQLRLLEARNLIALQGYAVAKAAFEVGYQSASQFNREYSRFFGASPARDTKKLKP